MKAIYYRCEFCGKQVLGSNSRNNDIFDSDPSYGTFGEEEVCPNAPEEEKQFGSRHEWVMSEELHSTQIEEIERIKSLKNRELYEETNSSSKGDDWDGDFTDWGFFVYCSLLSELESRLAPWLEKDEVNPDE